jgi:NIMA (never in mitosis gene a)-related kinase
MHYCESGTLASVISNTKKNKSYISESQIMKWLVQLTLALHFLHENHTLHRDLKPMNVMLTEGGDLLKVADFGLAIDIDHSGESGMFDEVSTLTYAVSS